MRLCDLFENASSSSSSAGAIATALNPDGSLEDGQFFGGNMNQSIYGPIKKHRKNRSKIKEDSAIPDFSELAKLPYGPGYYLRIANDIASKFPGSTVHEAVTTNSVYVQIPGAKEEIRISNHTKYGSNLPFHIIPQIKKNLPFQVRRAVIAAIHGYRRYRDIKEEIQTYPSELDPLADEARKCSNFEQFRRDFGIELKHGIYWHITDNPHFTIDKNRGPRDMSSMADGLEEKGTLMITSDLPLWSEYYEDRNFAARIDMSAVPRKAFFQVSRGFGNEFMVVDPSKARVIAIYGKDRAMMIDNHYDEVLAQYIDSDEDLLEFYRYAKGLKENKKRHKAILDSPKPFKEPGVLGPTDKVDDVGPILSGKEILNPTLSKKSFGV